VKLLKAAAVFTLAIVLERSFDTPPSGLEISVAVMAVGLVLVAAFYARKYVGIAVLLLLALLGLVRGFSSESSAIEASWADLPRNEERVYLEGALLSDPSPSNDRVRLRLQVATPVAGDSSAGYFVDVYTERLHDRTDSSRRSDDFRYGDQYRFSGRFNLMTDRDDIVGIVSTSSVELMASQNGNGLRSTIAGIRAEVSHDLVDSLGSRTGGLAAALLVGDRTKLLPETITNFRTSGLSHVLAISGLHIAMVGGIIMAISAWAIGRQRQLYLIAPFVAVWGYAALAGLTPSVTRAAIMFTVYLVARLLGRQRSVLPPLALAATIMLAIDPEIISSISFQLSFAAVLGIALFSARFAARGSDWIQASLRIPAFAKRVLTGVVYGMSVSLAATIATAPLVAFHFGEIPLWGIPSTLLLVPVLPLFIAGSVLVAVAGFVTAQSIAFAGLIAHGIGNYMSFVARMFADLPVGPIEAGGWSLPLILGWYAIVIYVLNRRQAHARFERLLAAWRARLSGVSTGGFQNPARRTTLYPVIAIWAVAGISLAGFVLSDSSSNDLRATFFETNRGDMIFIETPSGARLLIDGGDDPDMAVANLESVLPPLDRRIDVLLSTHPDADHLGGLQQVVERFDVGIIVDSGVLHASNIYTSWAQLIAGDERVVIAQPGLVIALDQDVRLTVLQTRCVVVECSNFNDEGVVVRLEYRDVSFMLTGDATSGAENDLMVTGEHLKSTVLKVGHHGSRTSTSELFLDAVDPAVAVVTTGIKNQFGHPHEDVITRLEDRLSAAAVFVTRERGTVVVITDGERVWVEVGR
jgi:competence protein ComEC